jgi:hypothetical protein
MHARMTAASSRKARFIKGDGMISLLLCLKDALAPASFYAPMGRRDGFAFCSRPPAAAEWTMAKAPCEAYCTEEETVLHPGIVLNAN